MPKVCMLVGYYPINRGGAEYQSYLLARRLRPEHEVFYISIGQEKTGLIHDDGFRIYTFPIPWQGRAIFRLRAPILDILASEMPDFVYQRVGCAATGIAALHQKRSGCRVIWHVASESDLEPARPTLRSILNLTYVDRLYFAYGRAHAACIVGQAHYQDELLQARFGRRCDVVIPNFQPAPTKVLDKRTPFKVVWLANLKAAKRPELFVDLARRFAERTDVVFVMAGREGPPRWTDPIRDYARTAKNFSYRGELTTEGVDELLRDAHVLVNTSAFEGYPNTFIEAWMRRVPILSLTVDPDGVLSRERIGFVSQTIERMATDLERLIDDPALRDRMGDAAAAFATARHSLTNLAQFESLLRSLQGDVPTGQQAR